MNIIARAKVLFFFSIGLILFISCSNDDGGPKTIPIPPELSVCFPDTLEFTGTYVVNLQPLSASLSVNRNALINGEVFEVDETGDDDVVEVNVVKGWKAKVKKVTVDQNDPDCFEVEYESEPFGSGETTFKISGKICKTENGCEVENGSWSMVNKNGGNHGSGSWNFK